MLYNHSYAPRHESCFVASYSHRLCLTKQGRSTVKWISRKEGGASGIDLFIISNMVQLNVHSTSNTENGLLR
jgi:hypothetical protein